MAANTFMGTEKPLAMFTIFIELKISSQAQNFLLNQIPIVVLVSLAWEAEQGKPAGTEKFIEQLKLKAHSPSTITTYGNELMQLLQLLKKKPVYELTTEDLRRYFVYCYEKLQLTKNTVHSRINAIKFYYEQVLKREKFFWEIPRPKRPIQLPKLLNENELARLFNALTNKKHKAILFTAYSAGLR